MHAGWPKFAQRAVGVPVNGGVAVLQWVPVTATTPNATVTIVTDFPFGDTAAVTVQPAAGATAAVPVLLRIPSWAAAGTVAVNGGSPQPLAGFNGTFLAMSAVPGKSTTFSLDFAPAIRLESYANGSVAVLRGALLYSLWIGQTITVVGTHPFQSRDLSINATSAWNVALAIADLNNPSGSLTFTRLGAPSAVPFNSTAVPVTITGMGRIVSGWGTDRGAPAAPPISPACAAPGACADAVPITLVPFGSTHVRVAVLPVA